MDFCFLADGRVLIANRAGAVSIWAGTTPVTVGTVPNVETGGERGLLSIAADPNFATNGYLYVYGTRAPDSFMHLDRFTCTGDLANPNSTNVTFAASDAPRDPGGDPDSAFNHNGGSCASVPTACSTRRSATTRRVGCNGAEPDVVARLHAAHGRQHAAGRRQHDAPTFSSLDPGNNPLSANTDVSQLLVAHGLRNPFRMEIDQVTGNLYIGDVGQNAVEEYDEYVYPAVAA
jgi:glucose/arabinose dehydrogenase